MYSFYYAVPSDMIVNEKYKLVLLTPRHAMRMKLLFVKRLVSFWVETTTDVFAYVMIPRRHQIFWIQLSNNEENKTIVLNNSLSFFLIQIYAKSQN